MLIIQNKKLAAAIAGISILASWQAVANPQVVTMVSIDDGVIILDQRGVVSNCTSDVNVGPNPGLPLHPAIPNGSCSQLCSIGTSTSGYQITAASNNSAIIINNSSGEVFQVTGKITGVETAACLGIGNTTNM